MGIAELQNLAARCTRCTFVKGGGNSNELTTSSSSDEESSVSVGDSSSVVVASLNTVDCLPTVLTLRLIRCVVDVNA